MKHTILCTACILVLLAAALGCQTKSEPEAAPKAAAAPEQPERSHLADKPLKLFSEKSSNRWKAAEAIELAKKRKEAYKQQYGFMVNPNRPDPQRGRIPTLKEALEGIEGSGPLKATIGTTAGKIECTLFEKRAEPGIRHFVSLARGKKSWWNPSSGQWSTEPFYKGTPVYRIVKKQVFYGGCPSGTGTTDVGYFAGLLPPGGKPEITEVEYPLSMILGKDRTKAGPQFTISARLPAFDEIPLYPIGTCTEGYGTIQKILAEAADEEGFPFQEIMITEVTFSR